MKKEGKITDEQYQTMRSTGAVPGKFYGLPKTHKKDNPLRPIISNCGTYNYNVAKFLINLLSPYSINDYSYVKDSFEFAEFIRQRKYLIQKKWLVLMLKVYLRMYLLTRK